ncbi:formin-like protein 2 [Rhopalosiphum padi]|uniref:formin-like protein 2 n=1 Tax=Rhopalosiphum padi TaxID=40932 RepID=UPI00298E6B5B|nr:formin-like protein 2 [Rhopalosiphum padi]
MFNKIYYCISKFCGLRNSSDEVNELQHYEDTVQKLQSTLLKQQLMIEKKNKLYENEKDKQTSRELQLQRFEETVNKLQSTVEKQQIIIETQKTFIERSYKTPNIKYEKLKNRIEILEREVTNNTTHIIAMNYSFTRQNLGTGAAVLMTSAPSCPLPPTPPITQVSTAYAPPPRSRPPPPPPPPPPPSPPPMTQVSTPYVRPPPTASPPASKAKVNTVQQYRIPITTEILKSVILKPPGERIFKTKVNKAEKVG